MNIGRISTLVLLSFLIIMFMTIIGCGKTQATSVISGSVSGDLKEGITINLTGAAATSTTTDSSGNFSFANQENGNYTLTPYSDGFTFSPTSKDIAISGASVTGINFTSKHVGYGISGTITGVVAANVTLTLGNVVNSTTTTTDSDGKYTLRSLEIANGITYSVKPSLAGYKFNPYTKSVSIPSPPSPAASVANVDFVSSVAHKPSTNPAQGTYTWDSTTGNLTITWPTTWPSGTTILCNWPQVGPNPEIESSVTITNTTMTWPDAIQWPSVMRWTRTSSTANNPAGVWTAYDQSGNTYTATFTATDAANGSISLVENIVACAYAWAEIISGDYNVSLSYQDPQCAAANVIVTGTGILGSLPLTCNAGEWSTPSIDIGSTIFTAAPYTYTFTIIDSALPPNTWDETSCFVAWPTGLSYTWTALTKTLTFSWTKVDKATAYVVQLKDSSNNLIWESAETTDIAINYSGAAVLTSGDTYYFYVIVSGTSYCSNGTSYTQKQFIAP